MQIVTAGDSECSYHFARPAPRPSKLLSKPPVPPRWIMTCWVFPILIPSGWDFLRKMCPNFDKIKISWIFHPKMHVNRRLLSYHVTFYFRNSEYDLSYSSPSSDSSALKDFSFCAYIWEWKISNSMKNLSKNRFEVFVYLKSDLFYMK